MKKRILAAAIAVCLTFGAAAALPQGALDGGFGFAVSAQTAGSDFTTQTLSDGTLEITGYSGNGGTVIVPSEIGGKKVTKIAVLAFDCEYHKSVSPTKIIISEGITHIYSDAFRCCDKLESAQLPSTVRVIDNGAFYGCSRLREINVAKGCEKYCSYDGVLYTKDYEWLACCPAAKTSVTIPNGVKCIITEAFLNSQITSVALPESLTEISLRAFKGSKLKSIHLPRNVKYVGYDAFSGCGGFESISVDSGSSYFCAADGVLYNKDKTALVLCPVNRKSLTLPDTVRFIKDGACSETKLESVTIPDSVTDIYRCAFRNCASLKSVKLSKNIKSVGEFAFSHCTSLKKITIPGGVKTIGEFMFWGCTSLAGVNIGNGVEQIGKEAFFGCESLKSVKIPLSVTSIGDHALGYYYAQPSGSAAYKKYSDFTVCGVIGSAADEYADEEGHKFVADTSVKRFAGANRYETAAIISHNMVNRSSVVILASGEGYADALAGVPLGKYLGAPILLTPKNKLSQEALVQIKNRKASKVIILGGYGAVSKNVESALQKQGLKTVRLAGSNRYGTAVEIAKNMDYKPTEVFFACAGGFADALSAGAAAALKSAPIIYLSKDGELNAESKAYLEQLRKKGCVKNAYVIGGTGVISDSMMKKAAAMLGLKSGSTVKRLAGDNRYETCLEVNKQFSSLFTGKMVCVSTGKTFPDALAGGVSAAENKAVMLLADSVVNTRQKEFLAKKKANTMAAFGGKGAVSDDVFLSVCRAAMI